MNHADYHLKIQSWRILGSLSGEHRPSQLCSQLILEWCLCLMTQSNVIVLYVYLMSTLHTSLAIYIALKFRCPHTHHANIPYLMEVF
jgi:hypothetical protein